MRTTLVCVVATALLSGCYRAPATNDANSDSGDGSAGATASRSASPEAPARADSTSQAPARLTLRTDRQSYRLGDQMTLTITNGTANRYTYNPCTRVLEREVNESWTPVQEQRMCTMIAHVLEPNSTRTEQTEVGSEAARGRYRVVLLLTEEWPSGQTRSVRLVSSPIAIGP